MKWYFMPLLVLSLWAPGGMAQEVGLAGLLGSKALLTIDGGEPQAVRVGEVVDGIKLLAIQDGQVVVEIGGRKRSLRVGQQGVSNVSGDGPGRVILKADNVGHFYTTGTINGVSVRFLVDTGATLISLGASDAKRIGLDFNTGAKALSNTANGQTVVSKVQLDSIRIGNITLKNIDAVIHQTDMPMALLGMSFLNRMEMLRDGDTMTLTKRF